MVWQQRTPALQRKLSPMSSERIWHVSPCRAALAAVCTSLLRCKPGCRTDGDAECAAAQPPAQQIRLRWANQVDALPPAYQAAGAGVLNDILGPSGEPTGTGGVLLHMWMLC